MWTQDLDRPTDTPPVPETLDWNLWLGAAVSSLLPSEDVARLVGNLATRLQKRIEWDAAKMRARNCPEADALIRKKYRDGFGI